jgi:hypothetical protein
MCETQISQLLGGASSPSMGGFPGWLRSGWAAGSPSSRSGNPPYDLPETVILGEDNLRTFT